jgi:hypothetical protein
MPPSCQRQTRIMSKILATETRVGYLLSGCSGSVILGSGNPVKQQRAFAPSGQGVSSGD